MILPTMTFKEMYDHLADDLEKIKFRKNTLRSKAIREFRKQCIFPAWKWYDYTIPATNNKYVIFFYAESRKDISSPKEDYYCIYYNDNKRFILQWCASCYKHTEDSPIQLLRQIHAYTCHFFERYNERIWKKQAPGLSNTEIICRYLSRNKESMPIRMNARINKRIKEYGDEAKYGYRVKDGFCFAKSWIEGVDAEGDRSKDRVDASLVLFTTFMNESDMADTQIEAINEDHITYWAECMRQMQKESKDGVLELTLAP